MNDLPPNASARLRQMLEKIPWHTPSHWYKYRCQSCNHRDWVEDIVVDVSADGTGRMPVLLCPQNAEASSSGTLPCPNKSRTPV